MAFTRYHIGDSVTVENESHILEGVLLRGKCPDTGTTVREKGIEIDEQGTFWMRCSETGETLKVNGWMALNMTREMPWGIDREDLHGTLADCATLAKAGCPQALADYVRGLTVAMGSVYVSHMIEDAALPGTFAGAVFDILAA